MFEALSIYVFFGIGSALSMATLAIVIAVRGFHASRYAFTVYAASCALWSLGDVLAVLGPTPDWGYFWLATFRAVALSVTIASWVWFCCAYSGANRRVWGRWLSGSYLAAGIGFGGIAMSPLRSTLISSVNFAAHNGLWHPVSRETGPLHLMVQCFGYSGCAIGLALLILFLFRAGPNSRRQILTVLIAVAFGSAVTVLSSLGYLGSESLDKSVFSMPFTVLILSLGLAREGLMRSSPVLLNVLLGTLRDPIFAMDQRGYLVEANGAAQLLIRSQLRDRGEASQMFRRPLNEILREDSPLLKLPGGEQWEGEQLVFSEPSGRQIFAASAAPLTAPLQASQGRLIVLHDRTRTQQLIEDLSCYSHRVAHDLKNPLTAIMSLSGLLQIQDASEQTRSVANQISELAEQMDLMIGELLLLASVKDGDLAVLEQTELRELTREVVQQLSLQFPRACVRLVPDGPWPRVMGRRAWVGQVLSNLLANALEHGTPDAHVEVHCRKHDGTVTLSVSNRTAAACAPDREDGCSTRWDPGHQPRGFGMEIVRRLVEKQGGAMGVNESLDEHRTTVWFRLLGADHKLAAEAE